MKSATLKYTNLFFYCSLWVAAVLLFYQVHQLFYFDEDIFVANPQGLFMQQIWQRSFLVKVTFLADYFFWNKYATGYHITNVVFHLLDAILAYWLIKELLSLIIVHFTAFQMQVIPLIFFVLFLFSPIHAEPICYILARGVTVVTFFLLFSMLLFLKAQQTKSNTFYLLSWLSFVAALFCYEISWTLPLVILSIMLFISFTKKEKFIKSYKYALPFFGVFAIWFIIKVVVINKWVISDYDDNSFFKIGIFTLIKNTSALFLRSIIPPFENSTLFGGFSVGFLLLLGLGFIKMYKQSRSIFYFTMLLLAITFFAFGSVTIIGIDTHDSESERYVYFSSIFGLMMLTIMLVVLIKNKTVLAISVIVILFFYAATLFSTIYNYKIAGSFSKEYTQLVNENLNDEDEVYFINLPSQYKGALMFRAKSRMGGNTKDSTKIVQEYLSYLYDKNVQVTMLSQKELFTIPPKLIVNLKPVDSILNYFPKVSLEKLNNNKKTIVALQDNMLYFFK